MKVLWLTIFFWITCFEIGYANCRPVSITQDLCTFIPNAMDPTDSRPDGDLDIVFFASWCSSCQKHIKEANLKNTIFINIFDEENNGNEGLQFLLGSNYEKAVCILDHNEKWSQQFKVKNLPYKTTYKCPSNRLKQKDKQETK